MDEINEPDADPPEALVRESLATMSALTPEQVAGWQAEARLWAETDCWVVDA